MGHFVKGYLDLQKVESVPVETTNLSMRRRHIPTFASIAELNSLIPEFEDIEWDTLNSRVR